MTRYLSIEQVIELHQMALEHSGGSDGIRDRGALESAVAQPMMGFGGEDLYPTLEEKAAALGYSLIMNHPFVDGNKRAGFLALDTFLRVNAKPLVAPVDASEQMILTVAAGSASRQQLTEWLREHTSD